MIRFLILEVVFPLLILLLVRSLIRSIFSAPRGNVPQRGSGDAPPVPAGGELKKDPVCGTYVSATSSITRTVKGQTLYFCSKECRDKY